MHCGAAAGRDEVSAREITVLSGVRIGLLGPVLLFAAAISVASPAVGQPSRTRTLTYDPDRKEWVELPPPAAQGTPEGDLHRIRVQIKDGRYRKALSAIKNFVNTYGQEDSHYPAILIAKAEALIGGRKYDQAHEVLQNFLGEFSGVQLTSEALRLEFVVAEAYLAGAKRKLLGLRLLSGTDVAYRILDEIPTDYPDSEYAELAIKTKADHLFRQGEHAFAELEYGRLIREHPRSRYHEFALARSAEAAMASFRGVEYDEAALIEAQDRFEEYRLRYPASAQRDRVDAILDSIREMRAGKDFRVGRYYERTQHLASAVWYYERVRQDWPDTIAKTRATERLERLGLLERTGSAENSQEDAKP